MGRTSSMWERVDSQFPDSQLFECKPSLPKRKSACIGNSSCSLVSILTIHSDPDLPYISQMPKIMRTCFENIVNVKRVGNYGF